MVLGCFVETLTLEERRVAGGDFRWNSVNNWYGGRCVWCGFRWIVPCMFQCAQEVIPEGGI